jgi:hypothetical protein
MTNEAQEELDARSGHLIGTIDAGPGRFVIQREARPVFDDGLFS